MSYLHSAIEDSPAIQAMYDADRAPDGEVPNYTKTFAFRPEVYAAWRQLSGAVRGGMDPRRYEVATLAAARRLRSSYCVLAHGTIMVRDHISEPALRHLMTEQPDNELTAEDRAVTALADRVAHDAASVTEADYAPLRELGLDDLEIFDVVLAAAARCFFSTVLDATGTEPDRRYADGLTDITVAALTVGRPIAGQG